MSEKENPNGQSPDTACLDGLTEIRVHGVGGTPPEELLNDIKPKRVAGDRIAGFYRTSDHRDRHREAYSWGGLTSHSPLRAVLWIPMLPSMLSNMAGWMARRYVTSGDDEKTAEPTTKWFRRWARIAALALSLNVAVLLTLVSLDTFAYQCLGQQLCRSQLWGWLNVLLPYERPGFRLAVGGIAPVAVAFLFFRLSSLSRTRYEGIEPPTPTASLPVPEHLSAAAQAGGLRHPGFWSGWHWHRHLSRLHMAAVVAVSAGMLGWCVAELARATDLPAFATVAGAGVAVAASAVIAIAVFMLGSDEADEDGALVMLVVSAIVWVAALAAAFALPLTLTDSADGGAGAVLQPAGVVPGIVSIIEVSWLIPALLVPLILQQVKAWGSRWRKAMQEARRRDDFSSPEEKSKWTRAKAGGTVKAFPFAAPVVLNVVALILANAALLSLVILAAEGLGEARYGFGTGGGDAMTLPGDAAKPVLWVPKVMVAIAAALVLGIGAVLLVFALVGLAGVIVKPKAMAPKVMEDLRGEYEKAKKKAGTAMDEPEKRTRKEAWTQSALELDPSAPGLSAHDSEGTRQNPNKWVRKAARARLIATHAPGFAAFLMIAIAGVGSGAVAWVIIGDWNPPVWVVGLVTWLSVVSPVVYAAMIRAMFRQENVRKALMTPFDVGTFFPRSFHPFAPPSYTERAVPELTRRIWCLQDFGGQVVLSAHSQGSVIAAAVLARQAEASGEGAKTVGLVTFGSPLAKLYRWAFPALFSDGLLQSLAGGRGGFGPVMWRNVSYATDYIGGPVVTEAWPAELRELDVSLVDPPTDRFVFPGPLPTILSHTGYWADDNFWGHVNEMCDKIKPPRPAATAACVHRSPTASEQAPAGPSPAHETLPVPPDPRVPVRYR